MNPLKDNCIKGNIILDLWAFKDSPRGNPPQKSLAVSFSLTVGFTVCLRMKTILFSFCCIRESGAMSKIFQQAQKLVKRHYVSNNDIRKPEAFCGTTLITYTHCINPIGDSRPQCWYKQTLLKRHVTEVKDCLYPNRKVFFFLMVKKITMKKR